MKTKHLLLGATLFLMIRGTRLSLYYPNISIHNHQFCSPNIDFSEYPFIKNALLTRGLVLKNGGFLQSDVEQIRSLSLKIPKHSIKTLDMLTFKPFSNLTELSLTNLNDGKNIVWDRYIDIINFDQLTSLKSFFASNLPLSELDAAQLPPQLKRINIYGVGMKRIKNEDLFDQLSSIHLEIDIDGACQKYRYPQVRWNDIWECNSAE